MGGRTLVDGRVVMKERARACGRKGVFGMVLLLLAAGGASLAQDPPSSRLSQGNEKLAFGIQDREAITVYSQTGYRGRSEHFEVDDRRLDDNSIGNDGPVSVRVSRGCEVTLYEHFDYRGISVRLDRSVEDLSRTRLGAREASSLRVRCGVDPRDDGGGGWGDGEDDRDAGWGDEDDRDGWGTGGPPADRRELDGRRGALLFSETGYRGRVQFFGAAESDLRRLRLGDNSVSSVKVASGCRVTLFAEPDFAGERSEIGKDLPTLRGTSVGPDTASSLWIDCSKGSAGLRRGVTIFADSKFRGQREHFHADDRRLADNDLGDDRVGSVRVAPGCRAVLYSRADYRGQSLTLDEDTLSLVGLPVGPDNASSLRVECRGEDPGGEDLAFGSGVWLYDQSHFQGPGVRVRGDVARLSSTPVGNDRVSSVRVAPGCEALLFSDIEYRGGYVRLKESVADLDRTAVRSNSLSSIRVRCQTR